MLHAYYYLSYNNYVRAIPICKDDTTKIALVNQFIYRDASNSGHRLERPMYENRAIYYSSKGVSDGIYWTWTSTGSTSLKTYSGGGIGFAGVYHVVSSQTR